ncbi:MerR family transcriptional regulator [Paraburkholderia dipogonis]|uniref:MerR family transcriptional regulator n=2 Tax=Paraburkholderia dipogonis TaxID=1211383 RepID=A0A4Y8MJZ1_9BURK|nr:MerR family transcriptional regulator [Paraburkholderia dipogonis]TFE37790.1 MerR family transcriptional regulator [Paraburkholderia dipogonis]
MPPVTPIQYTQDQMRALTGVSVETVRHWRKTVPYLASKTGKAARFTFTDLLGLAITHELVSSLGVHIAAVSAGVDMLFRLLASNSAFALNGAVAFVTPGSAVLREAGPEGIGSAPAQATLAIPLAPLILRLQQHMLPIVPVPTQAALPFPPEAVRSKA